MTKNRTYTPKSRHRPHFPTHPRPFKDTSYKIRSVLIVAWGTNQLGLPLNPRGGAPATFKPVARFMTHLTTNRKAIH